MGIRDPLARAAYAACVGLLVLAVGMGIFVLASDPAPCNQADDDSLDEFVYALPVIAVLSFLAMARAASRSAEVRDGPFIVLGCLSQLVILGLDCWLRASDRRLPRLIQTGSRRLLEPGIGLRLI